MPMVRIITLRMLHSNILGNYIALMSFFTVLNIKTVNGGGFLYLPINGTKPNNTMAQAICESYGSCELAVVDTQSEYDRLMQYFNTTLGAGFSLPAAVWVGLYLVYETGLGNYSYVWETGGSTKQLTWTNWDSGEPNGLGYQNCSRIHTNLYFRSIECEGSYDVLCEGIGQSSCIQSTSAKTECKIFAECWWTPARVGLISGFCSVFTFFCVCCVGWKCVCAPKAKVGYDIDGDDDDDDDDTGYEKNGVHNIMKNYNIDQTPLDTPSQSNGINSMILQNGGDTSWMSPEEKSFSARYSYKY